MNMSLQQNRPLAPSLASDFSAFEGMNWADGMVQNPVLNGVFT
jgi:hypothetical protein